MKFVKIILIFTLCLVGKAVAATVAIKLDLTANAKALVKEIAKAGSIDKNPHLVKVPHITIGFIDNISNQKEAERVGKIAKAFIDQYLQKLQTPLKFNVDKCVVKFSNYTVLEPDQTTLNELKKLNKDLEDHLMQAGFSLNALTTNANYQPHISLMKGSTGPNRVKAMNAKISVLKNNVAHNYNLSFQPMSSSYSVK